MTKFERKGILTSLFMLVPFTLLWVGFFLWVFALHLIADIAAALLVAAAAYLLVKAFAMRKSTLAMPDAPVSPEEKRGDKQWSILFAVQGIAIAAVCAVLGSTRQFLFIAPAVVLIVGLHYFPMAKWYKSVLHAIVAIAHLIAVGLSVTLALLSVISDAAATGICAGVAALGTVTLGAYLLKKLNP
jgi:hypothetical protein